MTSKRILRIPLILAGFALSPAAATAQESPTNDAAATEPNAELKALADTCSAHKFEMIVAIEGRKHGSKVRICGEPGQSDAGWLKTLESSLKTTQSNDSLSQPVKDQIVAALKEEIDRLKGLAALPGTAADVPASSLAGSSASIAPREPDPEYSTLPPLPTPKRPAPVKLAPVKLTKGGAAPAAVAAAPLIKPNLVITCGVPPERFGVCAQLDRDSQLLLSARDDLPMGTSLRFLRGGSQRAELDVGQLKKGASTVQKLPAKLCSGVVRAKLQVQVLNQGRVAETLGPWYLSCG